MEQAPGPKTTLFIKLCGIILLVKGSYFCSQQMALTNCQHQINILNLSTLVHNHSQSIIKRLFNIDLFTLTTTFNEINDFRH